MKILHFSNSYYPMRGGIESVIENLCIELNKKGIQSDVLTLNRLQGKKYPKKEKYLKHTIYRIPFIDLKHYKPSAIPFDLIKNYDLIHIHSIGFFSDMLLATKAIHKKPIIISTNGGIFHTKTLEGIKNIYFKTLERVLLNNANKIIAISENDMETFAKIVPRKNIEIIEPGFSAAEPTGKKEKGTILYVGRLSKNKGIDHLIHAFSETNKDYTLNIIGKDFDGILPELKKLAKEEGIESRTNFLGEVEENKLHKYYSKAEYAVSASKYEGFGITAIEAMHYNCKTILNNIPTFVNFAADRKAAIVNFGARDSPDELKKALQSKFNLPKSKKYADTFLWKNKINLFLKLYRKVLDK